MPVPKTKSLVLTNFTTIIPGLVHGFPFFLFTVLTGWWWAADLRQRTTNWLSKLLDNPQLTAITWDMFSPPQLMPVQSLSCDTTELRLIIGGCNLWLRWVKAHVCRTQIDWPPLWGYVGTVDLPRNGGFTEVPHFWAIAGYPNNHCLKTTLW